MKEISVVVQGAVHPEFTPKCLKSIRLHLPEAHVILSTWEGTNVDGLDVDEVILNKDPGAIARMYDPKRNIGDNPNNINRQIVSTLNGLKAVKTKYALKIRTDFEIRHTGFMKYMNKFQKFSSGWRIFTERVVTVLGDRPDGKAFFPYDYLFWGLTEDLLKLFDIPLMSKTDAEWFYTHEPVSVKNYRFIHGLFKYIPEQHLWMSCLAKKYPSVWSMVKDCSDVNPKNIQTTELSFANNFVCLDIPQCGIYPLKDSLSWLWTEDMYHIFHYIDWLSLYKKYCDPDFQYRCPLYIRLKLQKKVFRLQKHKKQYKDSHSILPKLKFLIKCGLDCLAMAGQALIRIHWLLKS